MSVVTWPLKKDIPLDEEIREKGQRYKNSANGLTSMEARLSPSDCPDETPWKVYLDDGTPVTVLQGSVPRGNVSFGPKPY